MLKFSISMLLAACTVATAAAAAQESCGEMERRLYLKPATTPLASPARRVEFRVLYMLDFARMVLIEYLQTKEVT